MIIIFIIIIIIQSSCFCWYLISGKKKQQYNNQIINEIQRRHKKLNDLNERITQRQNTILQLTNKRQKEYIILEQVRENRGKKLEQIEQTYQEQLKKIKQIYHNASISQAQEAKDYQQQLKQQIINIQQQRDQVQSNLNQLKSVYQAATAARLRQQEEEDKIAFYRIKISEKQINDITHLQEWKNELNDPSIVSKIIWSAFIMKPTSDLCNRVLGSTTICGIYKITNKQTGDIYIGQSVNIADRWKQHIKCGLGIDASVTNKLYNNMQKYGVWNFTFEILQKCTRDKLNEKERFWIQMYQSNKVGLNVTKGNK